MSVSPLRYFGLAAGLLLLLAGGSVHALDVPPLRGRVNDLASVLSADQRAQLEARLAAYEQKTGQQFTLLTVPSLEGEPIENFGIKVAERWKVGSAKGDEGLIMLIAPNDRKMRIEVGYGLEGTVPDAIAARIVREVLAPAFRQNDFAGGIDAAFDTLMRQASGEAPPLAAAEPRKRERRPATVWSRLSPLLLPLLLFFAFSALSGGRRRGRRGGLFVPFIGGGFGGGGGGGWGGGGGGGFSGGGGGFGGGGASGDW